VITKISLSKDAPKHTYRVARPEAMLTYVPSGGRLSTIASFFLNLMVITYHKVEKKATFVAECSLYDINAL